MYSLAASWLSVKSFFYLETDLLSTVVVVPLLARLWIQCDAVPYIERTVDLQVPESYLIPVLKGYFIWQILSKFHRSSVVANAIMYKVFQLPS